MKERQTITPPDETKTEQKFINKLRRKPKPTKPEVEIYKIIPEPAKKNQ